MTLASKPVNVWWSKLHPCISVGSTLILIVSLAVPMASLILAAMTLSLVPAIASAEPSLQEILDSWYGPGCVNAAQYTGYEVFQPGSYEFRLFTKETARTNATLAWYPAGDPESPHLLFRGSAASGATQDSIPVAFGLMLYSFGRWTSEYGFNSNAFHHFKTFAVCDDPRQMAVAIEDQVDGGDFDYNDAVLSIRPQRFGCALPIATGASNQNFNFTVPHTPSPTSSDGQGGALIAWIDEVFSNPLAWDRVMVQRFNDAGVPMWAFGGMQALRFGENPSIAPDGTGGAYITSGGAVLQHLDASGGVSAGWPPAGLTVSATGRYSSVAMADGEGGAFVTGTDTRPDSSATDIYVQRILITGTPATGWPLGGILACAAPGDQMDPQLCSDDSTGVFVAWSDHRAGSADSSWDIYAQHIDRFGQVRWQLGGIPLCTASGEQRYPQVVADGAGGSFIAWTDHRGPYSGYSRLYGQHVTADGTLLWNPDGIAISPAGAGLFQIVSDGSGGVLAAWSDYRDAANGTGIYALRLTPQGIPRLGWPEGGTLVVPPNPYIDLSRAIGDGTGGLYLTWEIFAGLGQSSVQHVQSAGTLDPEFSPGGCHLCPELSTRQQLPLLAPLSAGRVLVAWQDQQSEADANIWASAVGPGLGCPDASTATLASLVEASSAGRSISLRWYVAGEFSTGSVERSSDGAGWLSVAEAHPDGNGYIAYEDGDVLPGGRYGYRLSLASGGSTVRSAETWVEVPRSSLNLAVLGVRPNPAHGAFSVQYQLPDPGPVTIELVDLAGRRLATRTLGTQSAGVHVLTAGELQPTRPGLYYLQLIHRGGRTVSPIVFVR